MELLTLLFSLYKVNGDINTVSVAVYTLMFVFGAYAIYEAVYINE